MSALSFYKHLSLRKTLLSDLSRLKLANVINVNHFMLSLYEEGVHHTGLIFIFFVL